MNNFLKVPEGAYRNANLCGLLTEFKFYYRLKLINEEGCFIKSPFLVNKLMSVTGYSNSYIRTILKKLVKAGFLVERKDCYQLISYNKLWKQLGISSVWNSHRGRIGSFKIFKINKNEIDTFEEAVALEELRLNFFRQKYWIKKDKPKKPRKPTKKEMVGRSPKTVVERLTEIKSKCFLNDIQYGVRKANPEVEISTLTFAQLLGFNTSSKGHQLQQKLKSSVLIHIVKRSITFFGKKVDEHCYPIGKGRYMRQLCNKITIL